MSDSAWIQLEPEGSQCVLYLTGRWRLTDLRGIVRALPRLDAGATARLVLDGSRVQELDTAASTFVMIGQNRQAAFQQAKADHDFETQELELKTNTELTRQIHLLTGELHRRIIGPSPGGRADLK